MEILGLGANSVAFRTKDFSYVKLSFWDYTYIDAKLMVDGDTLEISIYNNDSSHLTKILNSPTKEDIKILRLISQIKRRGTKASAFSRYYNDHIDMKKLRAIVSNSLANKVSWDEVESKLKKIIRQSFVKIGMQEYYECYYCELDNYIIVAFVKDYSYYYPRNKIFIIEKESGKVAQTSEKERGTFYAFYKLLSGDDRHIKKRLADDAKVYEELMKYVKEIKTVADQAAYERIKTLATLSCIA